MSEVLVIVHLSSIDNYIDFYGVEPAIILATDIKLAILAHDGPVIVMDQEWDIISEDAGVLRSSVLELQQFHPQITLFHHDELCDIRPWQDGMQQLAKVVRALKPACVRLGGLWASQSKTTGCVHEVQRQLRARNIPCFVDTSIVALEDNDTRI